MHKISSYHLFILEIQSILESCDQSGHAHPKFFWSTFNLWEFVSTSKKSGYFIDLLLRYGLLKNPAIWGNTANDINFHCWTNSVKFKTNFLNKLKKPCFWPIYDLFSQCYGQIILLKSPPLICTTLYGFFISFYCWLKQVNVRWVDIKHWSHL